MPLVFIVVNPPDDLFNDVLAESHCYYFFLVLVFPYVGVQDGVEDAVGRDILDIEKAKEVIGWLKEGRVKVETIETEVPSPFAHNLIVLGEADVILMEDRKRRLLELHEAVVRSIKSSEEV